MRAVVLHECGGPEKPKFEDNVPGPQISGDTVLIAAAAASVNPIDWNCVRECGKRIFRCHSLPFWAAT
jgi:NADPH:quinone reductase-like Zn-dependent oxidoreductase